MIPRWLKQGVSFALDLNDRFGRHYGWAMASHIALSVLLAVFPFLIVVVALTSFLSTPEAASQVVRLAFENWPPAVAETFSSQLTQVLHNQSGGLLTFGIVLLIWSSSSGVEALRLALDSAYGTQEARSWWLLRLESLAFVLLGALAMFVLTGAVVLYPIIWDAAIHALPLVRRFAFVSTIGRFALSGAFLLVALVVFHVWLPYGRRRLVAVLPGVGLTLLLWLLIATGFGYYLGHFSNYAATYAGLGGIIAAILFLYFNSVVFILGAEFNAALADRRKARREAVAAAAPEVAAPPAKLRA
ncbi:MAG TPA: YihY/virulence factor BrkB family protein [Hyphomicrobiales bacterium]|nr:YihY/virulence factor BrkB family protein [Hyphomicrobiales bacterium]